MVRRRHHAKRAFRLGFVYPCLLILMGYGTLVISANNLVEPGLEIGVRWPSWLIDAASWLTADPILPLIIILIVMAAVFFWSMQRSVFSLPSRRSLFCEALADQCEAGIEEDAAISNAAELSGLSLSDLQGSSSNRLSLRHPGVLAITDPSSLRVPAGEEFAAEVGDRVLADRFRLQSKVYLRRARRQRTWWSEYAPRLLTFVFGFAFCLAYALLILRPIYLSVGRM